MESSLQLSIAIGILIFISTLLTLYGISKRKLNLHERLNPRNSVKNSEESGLGSLTKQMERLLIPIGEMVPRSPAEMTRQERKLAQAGIRRKEAVLLFMGAHVMTGALLLLAFGTTGYLFRQPFVFILISILGGAAIPDIWLSKKIEKRKTAIQHGLADAMDLSVVSVEAGLGLDQALLRVGEEIRFAHPDLADELRLRNMEVNMGRSRSDAFRNLADRTGVDDLKALVAILIQTDKFGTSIGQALRTFADSLRTKRRQRAEEQAAKLAIKMIVPMVIFIFPGVFIVILGPAFISIIRDLLPGLAGN